MARTTYFGSKKLDAEEAQLFKGLQDESLFSDYRYRVLELERTKEEARTKREKEFVQPYADLLFEHIKASVTARKAELWETLKTKGECAVFSYEMLRYNQTMLEKQRRLDEMTSDERVAHFEAEVEEPKETQFGANKWFFNSWKDTEDEDDYYQGTLHYPIKVQRIFRRSDLAVRIGLLFGPHFVTKRTYETLSTREGDFGWSHQKVTLQVVFKGDTISKGEVAQILRVAKETKEREVKTLGPFEWVALDGEVEQIPASPCEMPPLVEPSYEVKLWRY
jgi:hypothetical protein